MTEPSPTVVQPLAQGTQAVEALDDENVPVGQGVHEAAERNINRVCVTERDVPLPNKKRACVIQELSKT